MGRELQKKKNRSSTPRVRQKTKSKKAANPRANAVIAARWDKNLSLRENYDRLGLTSKLNGRAGGINSSRSKKSCSGSEPVEGLVQDPLTIKSQSTRNQFASEVRVRRDPTSGAILQVFEEPSDDSMKHRENQASNSGAAEEDDLAAETIRLLAHEASQEYVKKLPPVSQSQVDWLARLSKKYGLDFDAMARDTKMNVYQESAGMLRRKFRRKGLIA